MQELTRPRLGTNLGVLCDVVLGGNDALARQLFDLLLPVLLPVEDVRRLEDAERPAGVDEGTSATQASNQVSGGVHSSGCPCPPSSRHVVEA